MGVECRSRLKGCRECAGRLAKDALRGLSVIQHQHKVASAPDRLGRILVRELDRIAECAVDSGPWQVSVGSLYMYPESAQPACP
jgi:hypothetical protein